MEIPVETTKLLFPLRETRRATAMNLDTAGEFRSALAKLKVQVSRPALRRSRTPKRSVLLQQIEGALERINQGTYGICHGCFLVIPRSELLKRPYADYCARCQSRRVQSVPRARR